VPWVVAYKLDKRFSWTVVDDPIAHAKATRRTAFFKSFSFKRSRSVAIVCAHYHPEKKAAAEEVLTLEAMSVESNIALIEQENPRWADYLTQMPDRLRAPKVTLR
jgi:hypothetical protein